MANSKPHRIYHPAERLDVGYWSALQRTVSDLWRHRQEILLGFQKTFLAKHRKQRLGLMWPIANAMLPLGVFLFIASLRPVHSDTGMSPVVYAAIGVPLWMLFQGLLVAPARLIEQHRAVLINGRLPLICIVFMGLGETLFVFILQTAVAVMVILYEGSFKLSPTLAYAAIVFLCHVTLALSLGLILAVVSAILADIKDAVNLFMRYAIFVSFVIFPLPMTSWSEVLYAVNPVAVLIDTFRAALTGVDVTAPWLALGICSAALLLLLAGVRISHLAEPRIRGIL